MDKGHGYHAIPPPRQGKIKTEQGKAKQYWYCYALFGTLDTYQQLAMLAYLSSMPRLDECSDNE